MSNMPPSSMPDWKNSRIVISTLIVVAVAAVFWMFFRYRIVILILYTAIIFGMALMPLVDWLTGKGIRRSVSLALVYILIIVTLGAIVWLFVPIIATQSSELIVALPSILDNIRITFLKSTSAILVNIGQHMPVNMQVWLANSSASVETISAVDRVAKFVYSFFNLFLAFIAVFLLTTFWIMEGDRTLATIFLFVPQRLRVRAEELLKLIEKRVGAFLRGQFLLSLSIAIFALISYTIIGLPNVLVLALIAGIFEAVPIFGPALGAVPAILVAYSLNPSLVIWVIVSTMLMQGLENYLLVPRIMRAAVGVNPIITLLMLATLTSLIGVPGAFLAIPTAAITQILLDRFVFSKDKLGGNEEIGRDQKSALRYELQELIEDVHKQLRKKDKRSDEETDMLEVKIESIALELDSLLEQGLLDLKVK